MSSYLNIYVKNKETKTFTYLMSYSRNNSIYQLFYNNCPFCETVTDPNGESREIAICMTPERFSNIFVAIRDEIMLQNDYIKRKKCMIENAQKSETSSFEEKISYIADLQESINDCEEEIQGLEYAREFYQFLSNINEDNSFGEDAEPIVYAGIEACAPDFSDMD